MDEEEWKGGTTNEVKDVKDSSELENHRAAENIVQTVEDGKVNRASEFDGLDDSIDLGLVEMGDPLQLNSGGTMVAWIKQRTGGVRWQRIVEKSDGENARNGYALLADPDCHKLFYHG